MQEQLLEVSLGKRQVDYDCSLHVYIPLEREYAVEGHGQLMLGSSQGESYLLFTLSDGSELCWTIEKPKKFAKAGKDTIKFESPAESKIRTLKFQDPTKTEEVWGAICQALSDRGYTKYPGVAQSPTSERSALSQACAATAVESMSATYINPQNIDTVLSMIKNRPAAASELFRTMEQVNALRETFHQLQLPSVKWAELVKLGELLRKVVATIDSPCQFLLIGHDDNFRLVCSILCWPDGEEDCMTDLAAHKPSSQEEYLNSLLGSQASTKERASIARRMAYLRDQVLDPTLDFPTRKALGGLLGDHVAHILETMFHPRSMQVVSRWLARVRKGCILSLSLLKEITSHLAARDMQVGGSGVRNAFSVFFKDWRLGAYLSSVLQKARLGESQTEELLSSQTAENGIESGPQTRFQGLENANKESQRVLQTLTLEILQSIAEGMPSLLWQEFSHRTISEKIPDLLEELLNHLCLSEQQTRQLVYHLAQQILKSTLKPQRSPAPDSYGLFITRLSFLLSTLKERIGFEKWGVLIVPLLQGMVYWVESPYFHLKTDRTAELWHCLRASTFDYLLGPGNNRLGKEEILLIWQATNTTISLLTALQEASNRPSNKHQVAPAHVPTESTEGSAQADYLQQTRDFVKALFRSGLIRTERVGALRIKNGILTGVIRECIHRIIQTQDLALVQEVIGASMDLSGHLAQLLAPLTLFFNLVHAEGKKPAQAMEMILNLKQKRALVDQIQPLSDDKASEIFASLSNDATESRFDSIPLNWENSDEQENNSRPLSQDSTSGITQVQGDSGGSPSKTANEIRNPLTVSRVASGGPSAMLEEKLDEENGNHTQHPSGGHLEGHSRPNQDRMEAHQQLSSTHMNGGCHLDRDVDLLDFESTEECRLEGLVAQKSPCEPGLSRLGSRRASQSSPAHPEPQEASRNNSASRFMSPMIPEN